MNDPKVRLCLETIKVFEGDYTDDPSDHGGPTNLGISQRIYDSYRRRKALPPQPVRLITTDEEYEIFYYTFYLSVRCNAMADGWALAVSDTCFLCGEGYCVDWLNQAMHVVGVVVNSDTVDALKTATSPEDLNKFLNLRAAHHRAVVARDPSQAKYLHGWLDRVALLTAKCLTMAPFKIES